MKKTTDNNMNQPKPGKKFRLSKLTIIIGICFFLLFAFCFLLFAIFKNLPTPEKLSAYEIPQTSKIYDRNGKLLYDIYTDQNRTLVKLSQVPVFLRQATIAIEDKDFYKHQGINPVGGILRAVKETLFRQQLQGGSTITQQLVKTALLSPERTLSRKIREAILAFWTEKLYSKDQILEMYLNQVPYGGTAWGIEAAAQMYFDKGVEDLTLGEAALLAGLPAAPTTYSPFGARPQMAFDRQKAVLSRMVEDGYITESQKSEVKSQKLEFKPQRTDIKAPHFVMHTKELLVEKFGEKVADQGGLQITTTLDLSLQEFTQNTVASEVAKLKDLKVSNGAALITKPATGEILAMIGSKDYFATDSGNYNVTTSLRQPGSAIKPLNYAIGLETKKVTPASVFLDVPICFNVAGQAPYCPVNYDGQFHGPVQLRFALGNSYNIPAVKMMALNSLETVIASASAFGISTFRDPSRYGLSLTLGGGEVTMLDMAKAFGVFANTGVRKELVAILKVLDKNGKIIYEYKDANFTQDVTKSQGYPSSLLIEGTRVLSTQTSYLISHILLDNNARQPMFGPSSLLVVPNKAVSVKTGTTNDKRDNWTIGFTPNFLSVVWVGNNDNSPMHPYLTSGVTGAAPIWNKIMKEILKNQPDLWPKQPPDIVGAQICALSGKLPPNQDPNSQDKGCPLRFEYFIKGTLPKETEQLKKQIPIDKSTGKQAPSDQKDNVEMQEKSVVEDPFGLYCLDCPHDKNDPAIIVKH